MAPVDRHLDVGRKDGDEEDGGGGAPGPARRAIGDERRAREFGDAADHRPAGARPRQGMGDDLLVATGRDKVRHTRAREQR